MRTTITTVLTALALLAVPACGRTGVGGATGNEQGQDAGLAYSACMRDHDVDMPDISLGGGGVGLPTGVDTEGPVFQRADDACHDLLAGALQDRFDAMSPEERERIQAEGLARAACMREHGIDVPDPQFDGSGPGALPAGVDPDDPAFHDAAAACERRFGEDDG